MRKRIDVWLLALGMGGIGVIAFWILFWKETHPGQVPSHLSLTVVLTFCAVFVIMIGWACVLREKAD